MSTKKEIEEYKNKVQEEQFLRPQTLNEYVGQDKIKDMLSVSIQAAKKRHEPIDHVLLYGPQGLGKTTLAQVIANEMGADITIISGPAIEKTGDLAAILSQLKPYDVLFIDEIHRLQKVISETLYSAMEDFVIDIVIGRDSDTRTIRLDLPPFTLIGATTTYGMLAGPLRDRFGATYKLDFYSVEELKRICERTARIYGNTIDEKSSLEIARRSRGTPRVVNRIFKRVRDYADVTNNGNINYEITLKTLNNLNIDEEGLDDKDREYLLAIINNFQGGPVGVDNLASSIAEDKLTIENVYEPFLIKNGFVQRTSRGRIVTQKAYRHLKLEYKTGIFAYEDK
ncbi:MAG: Holliday junction branch migration DNA helicase RuvB [Gammaproteobacteria bacterium]|nr:Holliday junction branch migration DNA helicase RuvB [Gammaproteobacteria bacterium]